MFLLVSMSESILFDFRLKVRQKYPSSCAHVQFTGKHCGCGGECGTIGTNMGGGTVGDFPS